MTYAEAIAQLRKEFHRTRITKNIYVDPEIIAAILGYEDNRIKYIGIEKVEN